MPPALLSRRTVLFVNIAHAFDHFVLLIYPTAVIAIAAETGLDYARLIALSAGAFVAFGLCSLPMGWIADRFGRRNLLLVFFIGYGLSCFAVAGARGEVALTATLLTLGVFSAIYHPVGSAMLVTHARELGKSLGWNGVWGNLGAASASATTAALTYAFGWRFAFLVPGLACLACGLAFAALVPGDGEPAVRKSGAGAAVDFRNPLLLVGIFAVAIVAGGMTFNITTIALPKVIDERLGAALPLAAIGSLATLVFTLGALTQLAVGRLIDRVSLARIFVVLSLFQPLGLIIAAMTSGLALLAGLTLVTAAIYGQVVVNDAMVARYVPAHLRARAFGVRYFLGFTVSGLAAPAIAGLHGIGGFPLVLTAASGFGAIVFGAALAFSWAAAGATAPQARALRAAE
jgi:MFS family permease